MNKEKQIEVLEDLKSYVNEDWDEYEYADDIKDANVALDVAIALIKSSNVVGTLTINNKRYIVLEGQESQISWVDGGKKNMLYQLRTGDVILCENKPLDQTNAYLIVYDTDNGFGLWCLGCGEALGFYGDDVEKMKTDI